MDSNKTVLLKKYTQLTLLCCLAYLISYVGRLAYTTNITNVISSFSTTKAQAGYVSSAFFFSYGAGQLFNGLLCEKMNSEKVVPFSLLVSSLINIIMFFINNTIIMAVVWGINGLILSSLWCNLIKILARIKDANYVKKSVVIMSVSLPTGTVIAYGLSSLLTYLGVWKLYYILSGIFVCFFAIFLLLAYKSVSKTIINLHIILKNQLFFETDKENEKNQAVDTVACQNKSSFLKFLGFAIIPIFITCLASNLLKEGVQIWMPDYLKDNYALSGYFSILLTIVVPLLGISASIIAKWLVSLTKDMFVASVIFFVIASVLLALVSTITKLPLFLLVIIFAILATLSHSVSSILTVIFPLYYKNVIQSGKTAGIMNGFSYVGSTLSSVLLGVLADNFGWNYCMLFLLIFAGISIICSLWVSICIKKKKIKTI